MKKVYILKEENITRKERFGVQASGNHRKRRRNYQGKRAKKKKKKKKKRRHKTKIINEREMKVDIKLSRNERSNEIDRRSHKTIEKEEMNKIWIHIQ